MTDETKGDRPQSPVTTRWKKGTSGNPRGRPRKSECLTSLLKQEMGKICPADSERRKWRELVALSIVQQGLKGNILLLREIWDRVEGRTGQPAMTDKERAELRRKLFNPNPEIHISWETANEIRDLYGLAPYTLEEWGGS